MEAQIQLEALRKSYGTLAAVDGISFSVHPAEVFGLLGPNGAGKTTTISMITGLAAPDEGAVKVNGLPPSDPKARGRMGLAPQAVAIYDELTGRENVAFFGKLYGLSGTRLKKRVEDALGFVGLSERARDKAGTYSGGMKRRLNLAAALVHEPQLIILDEPTVGVDPQSRNAIFDSVKALRGAGCTVVYTTHYMEEAQRLCDRVAIMDHGKLLALDTVEALVAEYGTVTTIVLERSEGDERIETTDPAGELARLSAAGALTRFRVESPNLEQVFLHLTGRHLRD